MNRGMDDTEVILVLPNGDEIGLGAVHEICNPMFPYDPPYLANSVIADIVSAMAYGENPGQEAHLTLKLQEKE